PKPTRQDHTPAPTTKLTPTPWPELPAHISAHALRWNQLLHMQRESGNAAVQRMLHDAVQRAPLDTEFYARAERVNKRYAARPPHARWPYTETLQTLWSQQAFNDFADAVREFQRRTMGERAADGILGPRTGQAMTESQQTQTPAAETAVTAEESIAATLLKALFDFLFGAAEPAADELPNLSEAEIAAMDVPALRSRYRQIQRVLGQENLPPDRRTAFEAEAERVIDALVDATTSESIQLDLDAFNKIAVDVPAHDKQVSITVRAAYFIHTDTGTANVADARKASGFASIQKTLKENGDDSQMQTGAGKTMNSGFAVEYGKGTPEDIHRVVQEAVHSGAIEKYARANGKLQAGQALGDLAAGTLQSVTQQWIYDNGIGVDCSGFVVQALANARQKVRAELAGLGVAASALPPEIGMRVRNAKSFKAETAVTKPADLRPGDIWVTPTGSHVRIVTRTRRTTLKDKENVEFDTAESSGGSASRETGQIPGTHKTASLDDWGAVKGTFRRM
ncbi:MAG: hypothetical protein KC425_21515, partial [Anaerolineales bacterium]|nr:hypothetical protein [Anaerolineales bacterium]